MPLDDITLRALAFTQESVKDTVRTIQTRRLLEQANEEVRNINTSELNDAKKRTALEALSQQMVMGLSSVGATPDSISQIAQSIAPAIRQPQTFQEAIVSPDAATRQRGLEGLALQAGLKTKEPKDFQTFEIRSKFLERFERQKDVSKSIETINELQSAKDRLSQGTPQALNQTVKAMISALEGGRVSETDFAVGMPGQSLDRKAQRQFLTSFLNKANPADIQEMQGIINAILGGVQDRFRARVRGRSQAFAETMGTTPDEAERIILTNYGIDVAPTGPSSPSAAPPQVERVNGVEYIVTRDSKGNILDARRADGR